MKSAPFKAAKSLFDVKKVIAGDIHLWMAIVAIVRLALHWANESPIEGGSEALSVWIIMAVWGVIGVVKDIRKSNAADVSKVAIVGLLALLFAASGCSQTKLSTMKTGFFKCGMQCMQKCLAGEMLKEIAPKIVESNELMEED